MAFQRLRRLMSESEDEEAEAQRDVDITFGIEEEFWLVDPDSRDIIADPDTGIFDWCERNRGPHGFVHELLRSQIETNTRVCESVADLRGALKETRRIVAEAASRHGAAIMAASTHPFAAWESQMTTPKERYERLTTTLQESARRLLVSGMHIHAGFGDADSRIRVMTAMRRYLPLLHAISTSSPFIAGRETGYKSYRLTIMGALPRTGLPGPMWSRAEFDQLVAEYQRMKLIGDGSELWWDIRPSVRFPTIELRICDLCPRVDDAMCIAALYASLIRRLSRLDREGELPAEPPTEIIAENRWLAQRYGVLGFHGDTRAGGRKDIEDSTAELVEELAADAAALGCERELQHALAIIREGTGADRQIDLFRLRRVEGDTAAQALRAVVDLVIEETTEGIGEGS